MSANLFVYGTLMHTCTADDGRASRKRLKREARLLGPASVPGRLFDFGRYPGLVAPAHAADRVHGELLQLAVPEQSFHWLDAYEGIPPGRVEAPNEYARLQRPARLAGSTADVLAWVYVYQWDTNPGRLIPGGRWPRA